MTLLRFARNDVALLAMTCFARNDVALLAMTCFARNDVASLAMTLLRFARNDVIIRNLRMGSSLLALQMETVICPLPSVIPCKRSEQSLHNRAEPTLHIFFRHLLAFYVIFKLVFLYFAYAKVLAFRVTEIPAADRRSRIHC
jgi:hypothetical protein